jgi:uncharacterized protein (TIGR02246 family)
MQKLASGGDIVLAVGVGKQAVVADAMKAGRQHVQQEASHELLGGQGHGFVAGTPVFAVVLPAERDAAVVRCRRGNRSMRNLKWVAVVALSATVNTTNATEPPRADRAAENVAVRGVGAAFVDDWNRHDMKEFGSLFADDAQFVNVIGLWWHSRAEIQKEHEHEALHATRMRTSHLVANETLVHLLGPDAAVLLMQWQLTGDTGIDGVTLPMRRGVMSLVTVRAGSNWRIAAAQNTDIIPLPNLPPAK